MSSDRSALVFSAVAAVGLGVVVWMLRTGRNPEVLIASMKERPNILVIDVDTFSWDHMSVVRNGVSNTPNLDALAARGVKYTHAFSHSGWTAPALHAVLTGALPAPISIGDKGQKWRPNGTRDLPEVLGYYGYDTYSFWGVTIAKDLGPALSKTFKFVAEAAAVDSSQPSKASEPPTEEVVRFIEGEHSKPFFAYVHEVDLHRASAFSTFAADDPCADPTLWQKGMQYQGLYEALVARGGEASAKEAITLHYDMMVGLYDERIGQMLSALERSGLDKNTIVVVTSDHGDDFFEHAVVDHGLLYDSTIRVPLVVADLRNPTTGIVVDDVVQHVDIAPTLLAYAGAKPAVTMVGQPLPHTSGAAEAPYVSRPVFALSDECHLSWREADFKLILRDHATAHRDWYPLDITSDRAVNLSTFVQQHALTTLQIPQCAGSQMGGLPTQTFLELYDLKADPGEQVNVAADHPADVARLLTQLLQTYGERAAAMSGGGGDAMTAEQIEQMKAKGYWGFIDPASSTGPAGK